MKQVQLAIGHHQDCDVNAFNLEGISKPCNCGRTRQQTEAELKPLFGRMWHTKTTLNRKDGKQLCYWCDAPETKRALVNIWGNVHDVGACDACHPKHHGKMRDDL